MSSWLGALILGISNHPHAFVGHSKPSYLGFSKDLLVLPPSSSSMVRTWYDGFRWVPVETLLHQTRDVLALDRQSSSPLCVGLGVARIVEVGPNLY